MQLTTIPMESLAELLAVQLDNGGFTRLVVTGNSMYPTLRHRRDAVNLVPVERALRRGDLILYRRENGQFILHRIVSKPKNDRFICCGDNQWEKEPVTRQQVIAIVDGFVREGKAYAENDRTYRLWVGAWIFVFPLRRPLLALRRMLGRLRSRTR